MTITSRESFEPLDQDESAVGTLFEQYTLASNCYDEMFAAPPPACRPHYRALYDRLARVSRHQFDEARRLADQSFLNQGITFTVYGDVQGTERVFPFDL